MLRSKYNSSSKIEVLFDHWSEVEPPLGSKSELKTSQIMQNK